jgi:hypothetical protein
MLLLVSPLAFQGAIHVLVTKEQKEKSADDRLRQEREHNEGRLSLLPANDAPGEASFLGGSRDYGDRPGSGPVRRWLIREGNGVEPRKPLRQMVSQGETDGRPGDAG